MRTNWIVAGLAGLVLCVSAGTASAGPHDRHHGDGGRYGSYGERHVRREYRESNRHSYGHGHRHGHAHGHRHGHAHGHWDYIPGHYDRHNGHWDYHPGEYRWHPEHWTHSHRYHR